MSDEVRRREIIVRENFSRDSIAILLVEELIVWFRAAEQVEALLDALVEQPRNIAAREAFSEDLQSFVDRPTDWMMLHAAEKAPGADIPGQMKEIRKLLGQVDFFLMPDPTVPEEQALSGIKARVRTQAGKIGASLDRLKQSIEDIMAPRI